MLSMDEYLVRLKEWREKMVDTCPNEDYRELILVPWFDHIAPNRAQEYGIECWQRYGAKGIVAQLFNCFCRWSSLEEQKHGLVKQFDTLRDALGFSIIMNVFVGTDPERLKWDWVWRSHSPTAFHQMLETRVWEKDDDSRAGEDSLAMSIGMWQISYGRNAA